MEAPVPLSVTLPPTHTVAEGDAFTPTVGNWCTVTARVAVFEQLLASVPVTVYVPLVGVKETPSCTATGPVHVYDVAVPEPLNVILPPAHTAADDGLANGVTVGN